MRPSSLAHSQACFSDSELRFPEEEGQTEGHFPVEMIGFLVLACGIWAAGYFLFGRFIAPRWKVAGKLGFYLVVVALLHRLVGNWALIWLIGHPLLGIGGHFWWCRRNGINWITCQPRDKYLALRPGAAADGFRQAPALEAKSSTDGEGGRLRQ